MSSSVQVWVTTLHDGDRGVLSDDERARAARFHYPADRRRYIAGRTWVREMLANHAALSAPDLRFEYGPYGKPRLVDPSGVEFSLSHTGDTAVLAISNDSALGVDVERARPGGYDRQAASIVLSPDELAAIDAAGDPDACFVDIWTRKEAFAKVSGGGLDRSLAAFSLLGEGELERAGITVIPVDLGLAGIACAVATTGHRSVELVEAA